MVVRTLQGVNHSETARPAQWAAVALGSNMGDRDAFLAFARRRLREAGFGWTLASPIVETAPVGGPSGQGAYLNQALAAPLGGLRLSPRELLAAALAILAAKLRKVNDLPVPGEHRAKSGKTAPVNVGLHDRVDAGQPLAAAAHSFRRTKGIMHSVPRLLLRRLVPGVQHRVVLPC